MRIAIKSILIGYPQGIVAGLVSTKHQFIALNLNTFVGGKYFGNYLIEC